MYDIKKKESNDDHRVEVTFQDCQTASFLLLEKNIRNKLFYTEESTSYNQPKFLSHLSIALWTECDMVIIKYIY